MYRFGGTGSTLANVWFTSDLHIGHVSVAEWRGFPDVAAHDALLADNWDAMVHPDDVVWVLGDISAGGTKASRDALDWIKARNGVKHLVAGNHDRCHPMHRDSHRWQREYLSAFESVQMAAKRRVSLDQGHLTVMLSHFPYEGDHGVTRFPEWRLRQSAEHPILHGHTHSPLKDSLVYVPSLGNFVHQFHVGVDAWEFKPVPWDVVADKIRGWWQ